MLDVALAIFLSLLGFWCFWCGLHRAKRWHGYWWAGGLVFGLGMTLSFLLSLLLGGVALAILSSSRWRGQWGRPGIWLLFVIAMGVAASLLLASGHGDLALRRQVSDLGWRPGQFAEGLARWVFWSGPFLVAGWGWVAYRWRDLRRDHGPGVLASMGGVPLIGGLLASALGAPWGFVLWAGASPCLIVLVGQWMQSDGDLTVKSRWRRWALLSTGGLAALGVNTENLRMVGIPWPRAADTPRLEQGWAETASSLEQVLLLGAARQPRGLFVIAENEEDAALLDFYLADDALIYRPDPVYPRVHVVESAGWDTIYDLWSNYSHTLPGSKDPSPFQGLNALYLSRHGEESLPANLVRAFKSTEPAAVLEIKRNGRRLHRWHLFHVYDYQGLPL